MTETPVVTLCVPTTVPLPSAAVSTATCVAVPAETLILPLVPVIDGVTVSVAVTGLGAGGLEVRQARKGMEPVVAADKGVIGRQYFGDVRITAREPDSPGIVRDGVVVNVPGLNSNAECRSCRLPLLAVPSLEEPSAAPAGLTAMLLLMPKIAGTVVSVAVDRLRTGRLQGNLSGGAVTAVVACQEGVVSGQGHADMGIGAREMDLVPGNRLRCCYRRPWPLR